MMFQPPKVQPDDYIQFLIATPRQFTCSEAARVTPVEFQPPAHDAFNRLLHRLEPDSATLWHDAKRLVKRGWGALVLDDATLDKPYAQKMELVNSHWSGKHHRVVRGINLLTLLWTEGDQPIPCDYRLYNCKNDGATKNDHFRDLLQVAKDRGFQPEIVLFDSWYASLENLKLLRRFGWRWLTRLKGNRLVSVAKGTYQAVSQVPLTAQGTVVHLKGYGQVKLFRLVTPDGDTEYGATSDLGMNEGQRLKYAEWSWQIESYHRGIKQYCGVERCQARRAKAQRNHITMALRAFLRLNHVAFYEGISWFEAKTRILRHAIRQYLANPLYKLYQLA
jgi:putative transposase